MKRALALLVAILCLTLPTATGCGPSLDDVIIRDARAANNTAALTLEAAQSSAELLYRVEQDAVLAVAAAQPGATKESVRAAVQKVRDQWAPIKDLFARARESQARLASLIGAGENALRVGEAVAELAGLQAQIAQALADVRARLNGATP